jgi:hypothetical protein
MAGRSVAPLKVDAETDALITQGAHFLGVTKKDLVADAVRVYVAMRRADIERGVHEALSQLDGSRQAEVALLSGLSVEEINALGGVAP